MTHATAAGMARRIHLDSFPADYDPARDVLIGPWTILGAEQAFAARGDVVFEPDPFAGHAELKEASETCFAHALGLLPGLAARLNAANGASHGPAFWRLMLLPWLCYLVQLAHDRQTRARRLVEAYGAEQAEITLMDRPENLAFLDCADFMARGCLDRTFNHWLLSECLRPMLPASWRVRTVRGALPEKDLVLVPQPPALSDEERRLREELGDVRVRGVYGLGPRAQRLLCRLLERKGRHAPRRPIRCPDYSRTPALAWGFDFQALLEAALPAAYANVAALASEPWPARPGGLRLVGTGIYDDEPEKRRLGLCLEAGESLVTTQHGGFSGCCTVTTMNQEVEYKQHAHLSWGWEEEGEYAGNIVPLPSPYLSGFLGRRRPAGQDLILVGTFTRLYDFRFVSSPRAERLLRGVAAKETLLDGLDPQPRASALLRPYFRNPSAYDEARHFSDKYPDLRQLTGDLHQAMLGARLVVVDHPTTTFTLAVVANVPVVGYWEPRDWPLCPQAAPHFAALAEAGMIFDAPEQAAAQVNRVWPDVEAWWRGRAVQAARRRWMRRYAWASRFWLPRWIWALWRL